MEAAKPPVLNAEELSGLITAWKEWLRELRAWMLHREYSVLDVIRIVGLSGRYEEAGKDLLLAGEQAEKLRLSLYMGDYVL